MFFATADAFSDWLETHHARTTHVWVLFAKQGSGRVSQTWSEAVDVALCFGWIDGLRKRADGDRYLVRFTPRRAGSVWSAVNVKKAEALIAAGRMRAEGLTLFTERQDRSGYSAETRNVALSAEDERAFQADPVAWATFSTSPPSYRRDAVWWVMSAKREATRAKRLAILIASSAAGQRIPALSPRR
ncbi:YdeI/OmpD-associated family protein [Leucobacter sp. M11]|uniref:YdeI/OmpD-associated family protein n=1 Tax=Leucobacter sp. M11 TaxID=2993565 RepID=UPI002D7FA7DE|nr:YdeI/OmpD-associated family protein [Leucobacter sp. M11]MEB4615281.1 YdeI/OmpD-associated family protein [Leucobacter sp. M11]